MASMLPINDWVNVAAERSELPVARAQPEPQLIGLRRRALLCVADYESICFGNAAMVPTHFRE
jgi:hypothetical protein